MTELPYNSTEFWGIFIDASGLFLCCITIIYVLAYRIGFFSKIGRKKHEDRFNAEVFYQMMRQQFETSIAAITDAVNHEQQALRALVDNREGSAPVRLPEESGGHNKTFIDAPSKFGLHKKTAHKEVAGPQDLGLYAGQISEQVSLQTEEMELIAKLKGKRAEKLVHQFNM